MPGPAPKKLQQRRRSNKPARGEWRAAAALGWQHNPFPAPPDGVVHETPSGLTVGS